jgi:hypothetical protein
VTVGGVTEPFARIVKRAGTRTLIEPVVVVGAAVFVVFVVFVVVLEGGCVAVAGTVVVPGGVVDGIVDGGAFVVVLEVDFDPPQPATSRTPKRTASVLTFAG